MMQLEHRFTVLPSSNVTVAEAIEFDITVELWLDRFQ